MKLLRVLGSAALGLRLRVSHMRLLSSRIHGLGFRGLRSIGFSPQVATLIQCQQQSQGEERVERKN